ncbi:MAG: hypothetical protein QW057_03430, partial [Candidatus Bathyarchaeia archaeon]
MKSSSVGNRGVSYSGFEYRSYDRNVYTRTPIFFRDTVARTWCMALNRVLVVALAAVVAAVGVGVWFMTLPKLEVKDVHRDITLFVSLGKADFGPNDPIVVKVRLRNTSPTTPFDVAFNGSTVGSLRFNIAFYSENGRMVYNWTAHQAVKREFPLYIIRLNPG